MKLYLKPVTGDQRLTTFPISRQGIWNFYKEEQRVVWTPEEVDLSTDKWDYDNKLTKGDQRFTDHVLAFFASLDKLVNNNIAKRFKEEFNIYEIDCFYDFQLAMENIHGEMYSLLLETIITDPKKKDMLLNSVESIPVIKKMADWIYNCIDSDKVIGERLIRMAAVEGIFFIGAFCAIYWLQDKGLMKGLSQSNKLIARDESLHTEFALYLYSLLEPEYKISEDEIRKIFRDAVGIASEFIREALPHNLSEMNSDLMIKYIECSVDNLLTLLELSNMYNTPNPFHFMIKLNLQNRTNFFEKRVSEYAKPKLSSIREKPKIVNF